MKLSFSGHDLILHFSGVALWPTQHIAIVSDLHLEKGSHFARRGYFLPPYDSEDTLARLIRVLSETAMTRLIILGDNFHDANGYERLSPQAYALFKQLDIFEPVWIKGNHDADFVPEMFSVYETFRVENVTFRHQAVPGDINEISGHFHPKIILNKGLLQRDCFLTDGKKLVLPAFGSYTGGLSVHDAAIRSLFDVDCKAYALGEDRVYRVI